MAKFAIKQRGILKTLQFGGMHAVYVAAEPNGVLGAKLFQKFSTPCCLLIDIINSYNYIYYIVCQ